MINPKLVHRFRILKTLDNGAMLITDENKVAWVKPTSRREDGTFGQSAKIALDCSYQTLEDVEKSCSEVLTVIIPKRRFSVYSEKAYKVVTEDNRYEFLPKSLTSVKFLSNDRVKLTCAKRIASQKRIFQ